MSRIAIRYSKALFDLAIEKDELTSVEESLTLIKEHINTNVDFEKFLYNPLISARSKTDVFKKLFKDSVGQLTMNFLILLGLKKRSEFLAEIIEKFEELALDHHGIITANIYSSIPLKEDQKEIIQNRLEKRTGQKVQLVEVVENSLLGGFIVKIRDSVVDFSIRRQMERLKEKMIFG